MPISLFPASHQASASLARLLPQNGRRSIRSAGVAVIGLLTLLAVNAAPAYALDAKQMPELIKKLFAARSSGNLVMNSYYNFSVTPGDREAQLELLDRAETLAGSSNEIAELATDVDNSTLKEQLLLIPQLHTRYASLLKDNINDLIERQYFDIRLVAEMAQTNQNLLNAAAEAEAEALRLTSYSPEPVLAQLRDATLLIESMMTKYSAKSASNVSQTFQGAQTEEPLDIQAVQFEKQLEAIKSDLKSNADAGKTLRSIESSWRFLKNSYVNYNDNNVSYVVNRYSTKIVEKFELLMAQLG